MRQRVQQGELFFYIEVYKGRFNVAFATENDDFFSRNCYRSGNYFTTKEEGEKAVRYITRNILKFHTKKSRSANDDKGAK